VDECKPLTAGVCLSNASDVQFTYTGAAMAIVGRGSHLSTFQLNLSRFWPKIHSEYPLIPHDIS